jgi:hypothetical protein
MTLSGIITEVNAAQFEKEKAPIVETPSPRSTEVRYAQLPKAFKPMLSTLSGMVTDVNEIELNALSPIAVVG